ncbi:IS5 family transposase [Kitasatospora cineracea]|uniref:IS5 family transposase n=1 Tax=Kitasatospora cineracea TaxID=88074 RepID=UPI0034296528
MIANLVPDELWDRIAPLMLARPVRQYRRPGRLPVLDRAALASVVYVLCKGVAWRDVPASVVGCSGVTAWRRLRDWTETGLWPRLQATLLTELRRADLLDLGDCAVDGSHVRALKGGITSAPRPSIVPGPVPKHHLIVDRHGSPLAVTLTGGNRHGVTQLLPLLDAVPPIRGLRGRSRHRPRCLCAGRGYDFDKCPRQLWKRGIKPMIARRGIARGSGLGKVRWVVERAFAWLHQGLLELTCSIICLRRLSRSF